jgi:hypothetical protein
MTFSGDKKFGESITTKLEKQLVQATVHLIPRWCETYHLTLLTLVWSLGVVGFGKLAQSSLSYLWGVNAMVLFQYLTDLYDGAVGRHRNTGLVKWGFFMDHFLDFLFLCSLCFCGYLITPPELSHWILILTIVLSGYLIVSFLSFSCTNKFEIYHFNLGPTEFRAVVILINTLIIFTGTHHFKYSLPSAVALLAVGLLIYVWRTSKTLWQLDMETKLQAV